MDVIPSSLCMIVRDSSRTLPAALESIRPWVSEMIVVDTGSKDNTPEIARHYGAQVHYFPWCNDFAAARNESLKHARGQWLFWMDSDDTIDGSNGRKLLELTERSLEQAPLAYVMQVHCPGPTANDQIDVTVVDHVKLFRNLPEIRFEGRIHEQVLPAIRRLGGEVAWSDIFVVHSGSDHSIEGRQRKQERDLRLLELELQDHPDHPFALFNVGMTYGDMDRHEEAILALRRSLQVSAPTESHVRKIYALLVCSLTQLNRFEEGKRVCQEGLQFFPRDPELQFRLGLIAHRLEQLDEAVFAYRNALTQHDERHFSSRDSGITGYKARHNLALVYADKNRHDLAELQWRQVLNEVPGFRPAWRGLGESLIRQQRFTTAKLEFERMPENPLIACEKRMLQAELATAENNIECAAHHYFQAAKVFPDDLELLRARCRFLFEQGDASQTEVALDELCRRNPHDGAAFHNLGTLFSRDGRWGQAIEAFERSLAVRPNNPLTQQLLAVANTQLA